MSERTIFLNALDITDPQQRRRYLAQVCANDAALLANVERLLNAHEAAQGFLEEPPLGVQNAPTGINATERNAARLDTVRLDFLTPSDQPDRLGELGGYEVIEVLGQGGMGLVLRSV